MGNSLARQGLDRQTLVAGFVEKGYPSPQVLYLAPDATGINEWAAAWRRYLPGDATSPDWVFIVSGPRHLIDHPIRSPEKLAAFHVSHGDRLLVLKSWFDDNNRRGRFIIAGMSRLFANRDRIRPLLFYNFVPGYESTAQQLNEDRKQISTELSGDSVRFRFLLDSINLPGSQIRVIGSPLPNTYEFPPSVLQAASDNSVTVIDLGNRKQWPLDAFPDGYHLSELQAKVFTKDILTTLKKKSLN
ncbi:hypothetical protein OAL00_00530 [Verrucomicrobiales bacterium]|nr:hypothetical protein [Verrucomicrobiales bacterium]